MKPPGVFEAHDTITQAHERLTAKRPIRVWTHVFVGDGPEPPESEVVGCGPVYPIPNRPEVAVHDHEHYEICLVTGGSALHRTAMYESVVHRGDVMMVALGQVHGYYEIDRLQIVNCAFLTEWMLHDVRELWTVEGLIPMFLASALFPHPSNPWVPQHRIEEAEFNAVLHELSDIAREGERETPLRPYMKRCLDKVMFLLARVFAHADGFEAHGPLHDAVQLAVEHIEVCIGDGAPFEVPVVAAEVGMAPNYFSRIFHRDTGWSPTAYYQHRRIQHAAWLLLNTQSTATEVAHQLGFSDSAHFSHLFKRHQGVSPRAYLKRYAVD